ncbi:EamA family transporter [Dyadobacter sp. CY261]|uniref:EamA family transporter n=1 Tax=Dyadobacter sp. CY261 TaxID=2907203 RepID=UPI0038D390F2
MLLLAPSCQSAFFVLQKPLLSRYSVFELICFSIWTGTICMFPFANGIVYAFGKASLSANLGVLYLGIFPSIIGYLCWAYVLSRM